MDIVKELKKGLGWRLSQNVVSTGVMLVRSIVLARILTKNDFGVAAIAIAVSQGFTFARDLGFAHALVQAPELTRRATNTVFWCLLTVSVGVGLAMAGSGPYIAGVYDESALAILVSLLAGTFVFSAAATVPYALLARELRFRDISLIMVVRQGFSTGLAVAMAWFGCGYFSLVVPDLLASGLVFVAVCFAAGWYPRIEFSLRGLAPILKYTGLTYVRQMLGVASGAVPGLLLGYLYGADTYALYFFGMTRSRKPFGMFAESARGVAFPVFSAAQKDSAGLKSAVLRGGHLLTAAFFGIAGALIFLAGSLVPLVFGDKWQPAAPIFAWFAVFGLYAGFSTWGTPALRATGKLWPLVAGMLVFVVVQPLGFLVIWGNSHSITACAAFSALLECCLQFGWAVAACLLLGIHLRQVVRMFLAPVGGVLCAGVADKLLVSCVSLLGDVTWTALIVRSILFATVYAVVLFLGDAETRKIARRAIRFVGLKTAS